MASERFALSRTDVGKILKGAGIAALTSILVYVANVVIPELQKEPGANAALWMMVSTIVQTAVKFLNDTRTPSERLQAGDQ